MKIACKSRKIATLTFILSFSLNASAALIDNGNGTVYDTVINATWTKDANLLGTLETKALQDGTFDNLISAIIDSNPGGVIHDSPNQYDNGTYTLNANTDFYGLGDGVVTWWGAQAFIHYLNAQNYGGSSKWALPTSNEVQGYDNGSQLGQLYYDELGGGINVPPATSGPFNNLYNYYWTGTEYASDPKIAWYFATYGYQDYVNADKNLAFASTWAITTGNIGATVPVPTAVWLFGSAIVGFIGFNRRKTIQQ